MTKEVWSIPSCVAFWRDLTGASWLLAFLLQQAPSDGRPFKFPSREAAMAFGKDLRSIKRALSELEELGLATVNGKWIRLNDPEAVLGEQKRIPLRWEVSKALLAWPRIGAPTKWFAAWLWNEKALRRAREVLIDYRETGVHFNIQPRDKERSPRNWVEKLSEDRLVDVIRKVRFGAWLWVHDPDMVLTESDARSRINFAESIMKKTAMDTARGESRRESVTN